MDSGKVSESILKRSVLKYVQKNNKAVEQKRCLTEGAEIGADAALFDSLGEGAEACASAVMIGRSRTTIAEALQNACNNLVCMGAEAFGAELSIVLPKNVYESELRHMMEEAEVFATAQHITILGGHTMVSSQVLEPVVSVTVFGQTGLWQPCALKPDMDIVISKWIALQGTGKIAVVKKEELKKRLPERMVRQAATYGRYLSVIPEAKIAMEHGVCAMHDVSGGGIFRAVWEVAESAGTGIRIDLKKIPVKQETIEVCEVFGLNPYELLSGGAMLFVTEHGEALAEKLKQAGILGTVIGKLTDNNDRVVITRGEDGEEVRFLDRPRTDEVDKILDKKLELKKEQSL